MSVGDENVAVRSGDDFRGPIEVSGPSPVTPAFRGPQEFSLRAEFENLETFALFSLCVSHPHVPVFVDMDAVGEHEHSRAKRFHRLPGPIKLEYRREIRPSAGAAPHLSKNQMVPSRSTSTADVDPHFLPSGNLAQPSSIRYGLSCAWAARAWHRDDQCDESEYQLT